MRNIPLQLILIAIAGTTLVAYLGYHSNIAASVPSTSDEIPETYGVSETPAQLMEKFKRQDEQIQRRIGASQSDVDNQGLWQSLKQTVGLTWKSKRPETEKVTIPELTKEELALKIKQVEDSMITVGDKVKGFVKEKAGIVKDKIYDILPEVVDITKEKAKEGLGHVWEGTKHVSEKVGKLMGEELRDAKESIKEKVELIEETAKEDLHRMTETAKEKANEGVHKMTDKLSSTTHPKRKRGVDPDQIKDELSMI